MTTFIDIAALRSPFHDLMHEPYGLKHAALKEREGASLALEGYTMHVARNGVWSASSRDGSGHVQSYERIGYHNRAEFLLKGFLEAGGTCIFHGFMGIAGPVSIPASP